MYNKLVFSGTCTAKIFENEKPPKNVQKTKIPNAHINIGIQELSRIAFERCATAICAVETVMNVAETHGFVGDDLERMDGGESMLVGDGTEVWVIHLLPDGGRSAIVGAARVPVIFQFEILNIYSLVL